MILDTCDGIPRTGLYALPARTGFLVLSVRREGERCSGEGQPRDRGSTSEPLIAWAINSADDGPFGRHTRLATMHFQAAHPLVVDGLAGPHTKAALLRALAALH